MKYERSNLIGRSAEDVWDPKEFGGQISHMRIGADHRFKDD